MSKKRKLPVRGPDGRIIEGATATAHADEDGLVTEITMPGGARIDGRIPMSFAFREEPEWPPEEVPWSRAVPPAGQRGENGLRSLTRYHH
jgi:hypothetical protein